MITDFDGSGPLKVTIGSLPDEVLLEVFTFYMEDAYQEEWIILVHVCGGWRHIVFTSPLRLDLQLCVQGKTHVRKLLEIWPALPIVIRPNSRRWCSIPKVMENVIAALQHRDCVRRVILHDFRVPDRKLKVFLELMQHPFPTLTMLELWKWSNKEAAVISDSFLGGSAPLLQSLALSHVAFPGLPKLLLSASHLVLLDLGNIPLAGYISPEVMVASLSSMTQLRYFGLAFDSPPSRPSRESRRPPMIRTALPALTRCLLQADSEYVEDFVARIDAPLLHDIEISFFYQALFDIPQLSQFINRVESFNKRNATISFLNRDASVVFSSESDGYLMLRFLCNHANRQLSSVAQLCGMSLRPISTSENLIVTIDSDNPQHFGQSDIEHSQWEEILYPFTNVKNIFLDEDVGLHITTVLQGLVIERVTQVLPTLLSLFIKGLQSAGPTRKAAESFVAARQRFGHPVAIHRWEEESDTEYIPDDSEQELDSEWESDSEVND